MAIADIKLNDEFKIPRHPKIGTGFDIVVQRVVGELLLHEGEWPLDQERGFPWLRWLTQRPVPVNEIASIIPGQLQQVQGVAEIKGFSADVNDNGVLRIEFEVIGDAPNQEQARVDITFDPKQENFHPLVTIQL